MDGVQVQGRGARAARDHGHGGVALRQPGPELALEGVDHGCHVADGAVAEERHRAVRDPAQGLDLGPPHAAMADADPVDVEGLGDDDVVDTGRAEPAALGEPGHAAIAARTPRRPCPRSRLHPGGRRPWSIRASAATMAAARPPFMSQVPRPMSLPSRSSPAQGSTRPAMPGLDHVDMPVQVDARAGPAALEAGDDVEARVAVAVAGAALAALIGDLEAAGPQALADQLGAGHVGVARRVHGRDADELAGERHELVATVVQLCAACCPASDPP